MSFPRSPISLIFGHLKVFVNEVDAFPKVLGELLCQVGHPCGLPPVVSSTDATLDTHELVLHEAGKCLGKQGKATAQDVRHALADVNKDLAKRWSKANQGRRCAAHPDPQLSQDVLAALRSSVCDSECQSDDKGFTGGAAVGDAQCGLAKRVEVLEARLSLLLGPGPDEKVRLGDNRPLAPRDSVCSTSSDDECVTPDSPPPSSAGHGDEPGVSVISEMEDTGKDKDKEKDAQDRAVQKVKEEADAKGMAEEEANFKWEAEHDEDKHEEVKREDFLVNGILELTRQIRESMAMSANDRKITRNLFCS